MTDRFRDLKYQEKKFWQWAWRQPLKTQEILSAAFDLAKRAHAGQKRDEGDPYFLHPLRAANCLTGELKIDDYRVIAATLLHDVVEDGGVALAGIKKQFGARIGRLVKNLTRPRPKNETEQAKKISKGQKYRAISRADKNTRLIKCADMLDNLRSMPFIPPGHPTRLKFPRWESEATQYDLPLAQKTSSIMVVKMKQALKKSKNHK